MAFTPRLGLLVSFFLPAGTNKCPKNAACFELRPCAGLLLRLEFGRNLGFWEFTGNAEALERESESAAASRNPSAGG